MSIAGNSLNLCHPHRGQYEQSWSRYGDPVRTGSPYLLQLCPYCPRCGWQRLRLFPAIDIQAGRCVRLRRGDFADETVFSEDPVEMAASWVEQGANYLHVVDLDGARLGEHRNFELVRRMAEETSAVVQYGGGVRSV